MAKKRERLEVINDILSSIISSHNSVKPTRLLYASNLSPQMFKDYIDELSKSELIQQVSDNKGRKHFAVTEKGMHFLEKYRSFSKFVENLGL